MKQYYTYKLTDRITNEYYFGSRGYDGNVDDDKYMGSPYVWNPSIENLDKIILKVFDNSVDAIMHERELIIENINERLNQNYAIPHPNFNRHNLISAVDKFGNIITICTDDPLFGVDFFGVTKGKVVVRNADGEVFQTSVNDPRYLSGELVNNNKFANKRGIDHHNYNTYWINDGTNQKLIHEFDIVPDGWVIGTLQKGKITASSHCETIWVNDGNINKRINETDIENYTNNGFVLGRINLKEYKKNPNRKKVFPDFKETKWITNGTENKRININENFKLEKNWSYGRTKKQK